MVLNRKITLSYPLISAIYTSIYSAAYFCENSHIFIAHIIDRSILTVGSSHHDYLFLEDLKVLSILRDRNRDAIKTDSNEHKSQAGLFFIRDVICIRVWSNCFFTFCGRENMLILMTINENATCLTCRSMKVLSAFCDTEFHHWALMEGQSERDFSISLPISFLFRCGSDSLLCKRAKVTFLAVCVRILTFQMYLKSINLTLEPLLQKPRIKKAKMHLSF